MSDKRKTFLQRVAFDPSFVIAFVLFAAFYVVMHQASMRETVLYKYTTQHPVEYVIVALFIWGIVDIVFRFLAFPREILALRQNWLPPRVGREPVSNATALLDQLRALPVWLHESRVGKRIIQGLEYVAETGAADDHREHLEYLKNQDEDNSHANYMLIRFVIAVTPILGFIGTVVHYGTALSGFSLENMAQRLPTLVAEMGEAFDTTTIALAAAMTMMFALFICERIERSIVSSVNLLVDRELMNRFENKTQNITPFLSTVQIANERALGAIAATLQRQIDVWTEALEGVFQRFDARQKQELQNWQAALNVLQRRHEEYDAHHAETFRQSVAMLESRQDIHMNQIQTTLESALSMRDDFAAFGKTLKAIASGEEQLVELQTILSNNLRLLHETQQIDEALHGLTAAIHLLTSRHRQSGSSGLAAA